MFSGRHVFGSSLTAALVFLTSFATLVLLADGVSATAHAPIVINGDSEFTPENGVIGGNGTADNPYIIDGWEISPSYSIGISIHNTRAHFVVSNVSITCSYYDYYYYLVYLYDVANGTIRDSQLYGNYYGIYAESSSHVTVSNVTFQEMSSGVYAVYSDDFVVRDSVMSNCWSYGILFQYSDRLVAENNTFETSGSYGIYLYDTDDALMAANSFSSVSYAMYSEYGTNLSMVGNEVSSGYYGVMIYYGSGTTVSGNSFYGMYYESVYIVYSVDSVISHNTVVDTTSYYYYYDAPSLYIYSCQGTVVSGNNLSSTAGGTYGRIGVYLSGTDDTAVEGNNITGRYMAIIVGYYYYYSNLGTNDTRILGNSIGMSTYGIYAQGYDYYETQYRQTNLTVDGNHFWDIYYAIYVYLADDSLITSNSASDIDGVGMYIYYSNRITVTDNTLRGTYTGLYMGDVRDVLVARNDFSEADEGAQVYSATNVVIDDNLFLRNEYRGLRVHYSVNVSMTGNTFESAGVLIEGSDVEHFASHEISTDNTVNGYPVYYYKDTDGLVFDELETGQLILANCSDATVSGLHIGDTDVAVELAYLTSGTFTDIEVYDSDYGFYTYGVTDVTVTGLTSTTTDDDYGYYYDIVMLYDQGSTNLTVSESSMIGGYRGIQSYESHGLVIRDCLFESNYYGVLVENAYDAVIDNNLFVENYNYGMSIYSMHSSEISGNTLSYGSTAIRTYYIEDTNITGNTIFNNMYGVRGYYDYEVNYSHNTISSNWDTGVMLESGSGYMFYDNVLSENGDNGLMMYNAQSVEVLLNEFASNGFGLYLSGGSGALVSDNTFDSNWEGLRSENFYNLAVADSAFTSNRVGLMSVGGDSHTVEHNLFVSNWDAISFESNGNSLVVRNDVVGNEYRGVTMFNCWEQTISGNNISGSYAGIQLFSTNEAEILQNNVSSNENGIYLMHTEDIVVYRNNLVGNGVQAYDGSGDENRWYMNYSVGGNYWSDYDGADEYGGESQTDAGPDGIGDSPYVIDDDSADLYPAYVGINNDYAPVALFTVSGLYGNTSTVFSADAAASSDFEDDLTVLEVRWDWDGDGVWDVDWSTDKSADHVFDAPGIYEVTLEVRDSGGFTDTYGLEVAVDDSAPVTSASVDGALGSAGYYVSEVNVTLVAGDDVSGVSLTMYSVDLGRWQVYEGQLTLSSDGTHKVEYYSVDRSGNVEPTSSVTVMVDTLAPTLQASVEGIVDGVVSGGDVVVDISFMDPTSGVSSVEVSVDEGAFVVVSVDSFPLSGLSEGTHTIVVRATDEAGNVAETTLTFEVDLPEAEGFSELAMLLVLGVAAIGALFLLSIVLYMRMLNDGRPRDDEAPGEPPAE